ncbi:hypothetical protein CEUSTIGMA_g3470.t1 [Chlamydomonas eustigma]|uniref:FAD-binding domain-containing protein n=1 Tax=Chlamydomonas eustigma TaxID=1157962 RepID=A0A250WYW1_9CHLO|nr:hypothetical protein CEUSTIGMA_g3470.t1 [Chlamydomonas eustigma]|eukprot:GAX76027.1 hypothetical protein CEUSTIGMA_g3470.t1 [Chlamydomonas eustigma]
MMVTNSSCKLSKSQHERLEISTSMRYRQKSMYPAARHQMSTFKCLNKLRKSVATSTALADTPLSDEIRVPATTQTSTPTVAPLYLGKKAVVVGAGPAGSTAAMFLAREGFSVDVYERRPEPKADVVDSGRAYIIILIPRGKAALAELGISLPTDPHFITQGSVRHPPNGKVSVVKEAGNVTFSRSDLAQFLINEARSKYPDSIRFHFERGVEKVDLEKKQVTFSSMSNPSAASAESNNEEGFQHSVTELIQYEMLIGADGAASAVRGALQSHIPGYKVDISDSGREYKVYMNLVGNIEPPEFKDNAGATLHLWSAKDDPFMSFTAHRNPDDTYSGTFSMCTGAHAKVQSVAAYEEILRTKFAGIPESWIPSIAQQVNGSPASPAGKRIRCSQLGAPGVVLLGDAAHAVTPVFGQGANSSLESGQVLGQALKEANGDLESVPDTFDKLRKPDVHGLYEIDRKAFSFFSRKGPLDPDFLQLLSHVLLGTILSKIVPNLYGKQPMLLQLGTAPYSKILSAVKRDAKVSAMVLILIAMSIVLRMFFTSGSPA